MQEFVYGNMIWNAGLVALAAFFIRRWMVQIETSAKENRDAARRAAEMASQTGADLGVKIDGVWCEMRIANGRTSKIKGHIETMEKLCDERHLENHKPR